CGAALDRGRAPRAPKLRTQAPWLAHDGLEHGLWRAFRRDRRTRARAQLHHRSQRALPAVARLPVAVRLGAHLRRLAYARRAYRRAARVLCRRDGAGDGAFRFDAVRGIPLASADRRRSRGVDRGQRAGAGRAQDLARPEIEAGRVALAMAIQFRGPRLETIPLLLGERVRPAAGAIFAVLDIRHAANIELAARYLLSGGIVHDARDFHAGAG